ncbi:hypothetical protein [Streptomyces sp. Tue6028]|uniref:hypothetical protein n=1 Tax=Streptomyces sp. Tue6028 TaxID=2036037 RepID=UPI003EC10362
MPLHWLMALGERRRPETPAYADCPGPSEDRAVALVDDCGQLFPILPAWRRALGRELTGWAGQVEADDVESLPQVVTGG